MVHPSFRRKGIAKALIEAIIPLIQFQNYFTLIFSSPTHINNAWLLAHGYSYLHSEYYMEREELNPIFDYKKPLVFRLATLKDIPVLCALDEVCFPQRHGALDSRFNYLLNNREYSIFLAYHHGNPIGKAHVRWQQQGATLSDIAILPHEQGNGFGTALIAYCVNLALSEANL